MPAIVSTGSRRMAGTDEKAGPWSVRSDRCVHLVLAVLERRRQSRSLSPGCIHWMVIRTSVLVSRPGCDHDGGRHGIGHPLGDHRRELGVQAPTPLCRTWPADSRSSCRSPHLSDQRVHEQRRFAANFASSTFCIERTYRPTTQDADGDDQYGDHASAGSFLLHWLARATLARPDSRRRSWRARSRIRKHPRIRIANLDARAASTYKHASVSFSPRRAKKSTCARFVGSVVVCPSAERHGGVA
jgi:hypothetical protein